MWFMYSLNILNHSYIWGINHTSSLCLTFLMYSVKLSFSHLLEIFVPSSGRIFNSLLTSPLKADRWNVDTLWSQRMVSPAIDLPTGCWGDVERELWAHSPYQISREMERKMKLGRGGRWNHHSLTSPTSEWDRLVVRESIPTRRLMISPGATQGERGLGFLRKKKAHHFSYITLGLYIANNISCWRTVLTKNFWLFLLS